MTYEAGAPEMARLDGYITRVTSSLRDHRSRASFVVYAFGLLTEGERKSMEPMAARMCECPDDEREMQHAHDRMIHISLWMSSDGCQFYDDFVSVIRAGSGAMCCGPPGVPQSRALEHIACQER